jgi:hypothetical protein
MIGGLQYLTHTRPDIANAIGIIERFQANFKESHYEKIKRIFRHLKGTPDFGLWYYKSNGFTLCTYTDVDWANSMDDRKRKSGGASFLGGRLDFWLRKKQDFISQITTKVEYLETSINYNQIMQMK